jgi:hypothetical protein
LGGVVGRHVVVFADWVKIAFTDAQTIDDFIVYSVQYNYTYTNRPGQVLGEVYRLHINSIPGEHHRRARRLPAHYLNRGAGQLTITVFSKRIR